MYTKVDGGGSPVLMQHGAGASSWMWGPALELLTPTVKTIVPDLPGFGRSADQPYVSHQATVRELTDVLDRYAPQGAHIIGFSLGAQLGIPKYLLDEYLHDSTTTSHRTLIASVAENIRFTLPTTWSDYPGQATVLVGAKERKLMRDSAELTASACPGSTLRTVEGAAHDIPLKRPAIIASTLNRHISF